MSTNQQKFQYISKWLKKVLQTEQIPSFEINDRTIQILYDLAKCNEQKNLEYEQISEDIEQKTKEYAAESSRIESQLQQCGMQLNNFSQTGVMSVKTISEIAQILDVKDVKRSRSSLI